MGLKRYATPFTSNNVDADAFYAAPDSVAARAPSLREEIEAAKQIAGSIHRDVAGFTARLDCRADEILDEAVSRRLASILRWRRTIQILSYLAGAVTGAGLTYAFGG